MNDYFFWFSQPSSILSKQDNMIGYAFAGLTGLAVILLIAATLGKHKVVKKLTKKFFYLFLTTGLLGVLWFGFRYENTPIFGRRYWAGFVAILFIVWLIHVLKYLAVRFRQEKSEYDKFMLNSKYIPKGKK